MRCVMLKESVKVFARAIHCLARIGFEIYVEPLKKGLTLRTVNSSRSAYACFVFFEDFFYSYDDGISEDSSDEAVKCKLSVKSCLTIFKSLSIVEKIVGRCTIKINDPEEDLKFILHCQHGIVKTYNLSYQECETLQAVFHKDLYPNVMSVQPRILSEVVTNFHNTQDEISLTVCPQNLVVSNYVDEDQDTSKVIKTQMILVGEEFEKFQIGFDTEVTFCLKELRAIVLFGEAVDQKINVHFESAGKPIVFSLNSDPTFEANFVLATLVDVLPTQTSHEEVKQKERPCIDQENDQRQTSTHSMLMEDEFDLDEEDDWVNNVMAIEENALQKTLKCCPNSNKSKPSTQTRTSQSLQQATNVLDKPTKSHSKTNEHSEISKANFWMPTQSSGDAEKSPGIAVHSRQNKGIIASENNQDSIKSKAFKITDEDEPAFTDSIPGTPPSKKFKSMFFSALTGKNKAKPRSNQTIVLAEDSDPDSD